MNKYLYSRLFIHVYTLLHFYTQKIQVHFAALVTIYFFYTSAAAISIICST